MWPDPARLMIAGTCSINSRLRLIPAPGVREMLRGVRVRGTRRTSLSHRAVSENLEDTEGDRAKGSVAETTVAWSSDKEQKELRGPLLKILSCRIWFRAQLIPTLLVVSSRSHCGASSCLSALDALRGTGLVASLSSAVAT